MKCESVRTQLTAYLDGDLDDHRGSAVRGHLRGCEACRNVASEEALLRDSLRALPPLDPPASLWAGVQARIAAEEVKDAEHPAWRRAVGWFQRRAPQLGIAGFAIAAAIVLLVMRDARDDEDTRQVANPPAEQKTEVAATDRTESPRATGDCNLASGDGDVTAALAAEPGKVTACYAQTAGELLELANQARGEWPQDRQDELDAEVESLQQDVAVATNERSRQRAYRKLIRYLQRAVIRDDVALASLGGTR